MTLRYPQVLLLLCAFNAWPMAMAADSVKLDTPVGGWRTGAPEGEGENFRQTVNYPASSVDTRSARPTPRASAAKSKPPPRTRSPAG